MNNRTVSGRRPRRRADRCRMVDVPVLACAQRHEQGGEPGQGGEGEVALSRNGAEAARGPRAASCPQVETDRDRLRNAVPDQPELASFIEQANQLGTDTGVTWVSVSPSEPSAGTAAGTVTVALEVTGGFFQVLDYLNRLEALAGSSSSTGSTASAAPPVVLRPAARRHHGVAHGPHVHDWRRPRPPPGTTTPATSPVVATSRRRKDRGADMNTGTSPRSCSLALPASWSCLPRQVRRVQRGRRLRQRAGDVTRCPALQSNPRDRRADSRAVVALDPHARRRTVVVAAYQDPVRAGDHRHVRSAWRGAILTTGWLESGRSSSACSAAPRSPGSGRNACPTTAGTASPRRRPRRRQRARVRGTSRRACSTCSRSRTAPRWPRCRSVRPCTRLGKATCSPRLSRREPQRAVRPIPAR